MVYMKYFSGNEHEETCTFEMYEGAALVFCGKPAVGRRGMVEATVQPLCEEHFNYGIGMEKVPPSDIKMEKEGKPGVSGG